MKSKTEIIESLELILVDLGIAAIDTEDETAKTDLNNAIELIQLASKELKKL